MFAGLDFRYVHEAHFAECDDLTLQIGDTVIARTVRAKEIARVVALKPGLEQPIDEERQFVKKILRVANDKDVAREKECRLREKKAHFIAVRKIQRLNLPMKLIRVRYLFDHSRIIFFFKAPTKVDFRQLVKDLAAVFRTRIELRQIGVRDEAKMIGGTGTCGRELCCTTFLRGFVPVTVRMAKLQHQSVNPSKITGQCGRLKCCIVYEYPFYEELMKGVPPAGAQLETDEFKGQLVKINLFSGFADIVTEEGRLMTVPLDKVRDARYAISQEDLEAFSRMEEGDMGEMPTS